MAMEMELSIYQIDAFAKRAFEGNPAAVVPLQQWLPDSTMQAIAEENNLAETVFFVPQGDGFHIRWFTPNKEVKLCGHATLAAAYVLFNELGLKASYVNFDSLSGPLSVEKRGERLCLNFPAQPPQICESPAALLAGLGNKPEVVLASEDYIAVYASEAELLAIEPDQEQLKQLPLRGVIVTAPSERYDFVARFFSPNYGIPEDSVTGSAYTQLMPYWADRLDRLQLNAKQVSSRGGELFCELQGDRVLIAGHAVKYLQGAIKIAVG